MTPNISIIVPVYNAQQYILKLYDCLSNQTLKNIEIIFINDGSTDNSQAILKEISEIDNRVKVINTKNQGVGAARNLGVSLSKGEYIAFVDCDDWVDLNAYETMYNLTKCNAEVIICQHVREYESIGKRTIVKHDLLENKLETKSKFSKTLYPYLISSDKLSSPCDKIIKRELLINNKIKFPMTKIGEDYIFNMLLFTHCSAYLYIPEPFYHYRIYNQNTVSSSGLDMYDNYVTVKKYKDDFIKLWQIELDIKVKSDILFFERTTQLITRMLMDSKYTIIKRAKQSLKILRSNEIVQLIRYKSIDCNSKLCKMLLYLLRNRMNVVILIVCLLYGFYLKSNNIYLSKKLLMNR